MMIIDVGVTDNEPERVQHTLMYYVLPSIVSALICIAICCGAYRCIGHNDKIEEDMDETLLLENQKSVDDAMIDEERYNRRKFDEIHAVDVPSLGAIDFDSNLMRTPPECRGYLEYVD